MPVDPGANITPLPVKRRGKDRLTTKSRLLSLDSLDRRTKAAQNARRRIAELQAAVGNPNPGQALVCERLALLACVAEHAEVLWLQGEAIPLADYVSTCNSIQRLAQSLGLLSRDAATYARVIDNYTDEDVARMVAEVRAEEPAHGE
jgi:hypothetical protein